MAEFKALELASSQGVFETEEEQHKADDAYHNFPRGDYVTPPSRLRLLLQQLNDSTIQHHQLITAYEQFTSSAFQDNEAKAVPEHRSTRKQHHSSGRQEAPGNSVVSS